MIIIINGALGVGKTSVSEELLSRFDKSVHLDGDHIGNVHPFEIYDEARIEHLYKTLAQLVRFHKNNGYPNFVINYVFETSESLDQLVSLLRPLDDTIHVYWLTCNESEHARRVKGRAGVDLVWEMDRFVELQKIQRTAAQKGFIGVEMDTSELTPVEVADAIWKDIFY